MAGGARVEQEVRGVRRHCPTPRGPRCPRVVAVRSLSQDSSKIAQQTLIFCKGALISVNAEVLRPQEEMGASEPESRANTPRAPGSSEPLAADLPLRAAQGPVVPPGQHDLGFWSERGACSRSCLELNTG